MGEAPPSEFPNSPPPFTSATSAVSTGNNPLIILWCCPSLAVAPPSWRLQCRLEAGVTAQIRTVPSSEGAIYLSPGQRPGSKTLPFSGAEPRKGEIALRAACGSRAAWWDVRLLSYISSASPLLSAGNCLLPTAYRPLRACQSSTYPPRTARHSSTRTKSAGSRPFIQVPASNRFRVANNAEPIQFHQSVRNLDPSSLWKLHRRVLLGMTIRGPLPISAACFISTWIFGGRRTSFLKTIESNPL